MDKPIRVLQVNASSKNFGGVSKFVYEVYKRIDKEKLQFDVLSPKRTTYEICRNEMEEMGANIYELGIDEQKNGLRFYIELLFKTLNFLDRHHYAIIHINSGVITFNLIIALGAKMRGIKKIIVHSHNTKAYTNKIKKTIANIEKNMIKYLATDYLACSNLAAESMFPKKLIKSNKIKIIKNGIEIEKFKFNSNIREEYRKKLEIEDKFIIGHVGRFCEQKNHNYLIDIFKEINKLNKNAVLLLIGEGELEAKIRDKVKEYNLEDYVMFLGLRKDVIELMQAMDVFILPSKHEGLPIVGIESQTSGLKTYFSDTITTETKVSNNAMFLSIKDEPIKWAEKILKENNDEINRQGCYKQVQKAGYDISTTYKELERIYIEE